MGGTLALVSQPQSDALAELLSWQDGVISRPQAADHGVSDDALRARVEGGRWQRIHTGIYSTTTGHLTVAARQWAAVLYCGPGSALSHETAAALYGLAVADKRIHVTIPAPRHIAAPAGLVLHRSRRLAWSRHPVLEPPRITIEATVIDLVHAAPAIDRALSVVSQACQRRLTTAGRLQAELTARRTVRWRREVLPALDDVAGGAHSLLELLYLRNVERRHGLPNGRRQRPVQRTLHREWSDVSYDEYATVVELDGRLGHDHVDQVWRDMRRDNAAVVAGEAPLRYGWADVTGRPCAAAGEVGAVLRSRGWSGRPRKCGASCGL